MNYKTILFLAAILFFCGNCKIITVPGASPYKETYTTGWGAAYTVKLSCDNFATLVVWENPSDDGTPAIRKHSIRNTFKAKRSEGVFNSVTIDIEINSDLGVETTCDLGITEDKTGTVILLVVLVVGIFLAIVAIIMSVGLFIQLCKHSKDGGDV